MGLLGEVKHSALCVLVQTKLVSLDSSACDHRGFHRRDSRQRTGLSNQTARSRPCQGRAGVWSNKGRKGPETAASTGNGGDSRFVPKLAYRGLKAESVPRQSRVC